jgi:hypothetical protein
MATASARNTNELEDKLAMLALQFRQAEPNSSRREAIAFQYGKVFDDLIKAAGCFVELDFDSLLPDGYMPSQYESRKARTSLGVSTGVSYKGKLQPFTRWVIRFVSLKAVRDMWVRDH